MFILVFGLLGMVIGSFIGAAVIRVPRHESVIAGRSRCDGCNRKLGPLELIPIVSFLSLRGRCATCRTPILVDQLVAEIGGAIIAIGSAWTANDLMMAVALCVFGWTLLALALLDARHFWLPDALTQPLLLLGLASALVITDISLLARLVGAVTGFLVLDTLRLVYHHRTGRDGLGRGDAKLLAAIGAWLGALALPWVILIAGLIGLLWASLNSHRRVISRHDRLPLGTLMALAVFLIAPFILGKP